MWHALLDGFPNNVGSEGGQVRVDEEHVLGARITLEEGGVTAPWSITCGIYGWMCHTRFISLEAEARAQLPLMKSRMEDILEMIPAAEAPDCDAKMKAVVNAIEKFVDDYP